MSDRSLWGEIPSGTKIRTIRSILEKQGQILTESTNKVLRGHVGFFRSTGTQEYVFETHEYDFIVRFYIVAPLLEDYQYEVLKVFHGVTLYPALVESEALPANFQSRAQKKANNEEEFLSVVEVILTSETVRSIVGALLSQSGDVSEK